MNNNKKKIFLLASAGLITLSSMAVVLFEQRGGEFAQLKAPANSSRVITVNSTNRILDFYDNGNKYFNGAMFQLDDKLAYNYVYASQSQELVLENHNNCILALWGDFGGCYFTINFQYLTSKVFSFDREQTNKITLAKFRHLTRVDITLDKGEGWDRFTSLSAESGTFTLLKDADTYVKYQWIPEGGFLGSDTDVNFEPGETWGKDHKAIWITEMVFYYDC